MTVLLYLLLTLPCVYLVTSLGDLACNFGNSFTTGAGDWSQDGSCTFQNTNSQSGAMVWIGENIPDSRNWTDYTVEVRMDPTDTESGGANGGLAFNIQQVGTGGDSGRYYGIALFPTYGSDKINLNLIKWNNGYDPVDSYSAYNDTIQPGQYFDLSITVTSSNINGVDTVTISSYLDGQYLGTWSDTDEPHMGGSVGLRNYNLPAKYKNFYVHFPGEDDATSSSGSGGWIFIGVMFGVLFLYCVIGYVINGVKGKEWGNYERNVPHLTFWKVLPKLIYVGCQVSIETIRGVLCKKVGGGDDSLMGAETADAVYGNDDAEDQNL